MKLLADEASDHASPSSRSVSRMRFVDETPDLAVSAREDEYAIDRPWAFTHPFDEPE